MSLMFVPQVERNDNLVLRGMTVPGKTSEAVQLQQLLDESKLEIARAFTAKVSLAELLPSNSWEGMLLRSTYEAGAHPDIILHLLDHFGDRNVAVINTSDTSLGRGLTHFTYEDHEVDDICYLSRELGGLLSYTTGGYLAFIGTTPESHYQSGLNLSGTTTPIVLFTRVYQALRESLSSEFLRQMVNLVDVYPELHNGHISSPADGIVYFNISRRKLPVVYSSAEFVKLPGIRTPVYVDLKGGRAHGGCSVLFSILQEYVTSCANP